MKPLACDDVEAQIELFAAGDCDPATNAAARAHLAGCDRCGRSLEEARRLLGLLDARYQEPERLARLWDRLEIEGGRPFWPPSMKHPWLRRAVALAAMLLLVVGLFGWLSSDRSGTGPGTTELQLALNRPRDFTRWPQHAIAEPAEPRGRRVAAQEKGQEPSVTVVIRTAPGAQWQMGPGPRVNLRAGELLVQVNTRKGPGGVSFEASTPAGLVSARKASFLIGAQQGHFGRWTFVVVQQGKAQLANKRGRVEGAAGAVLWVVEDRPPNQLRTAAPPAR
jgi:hypothetical protein